MVQLRLLLAQCEQWADYGEASKMKDSKTYIQYCRYYHGEENCPESIKRLPAG